MRRQISGAADKWADPALDEVDRRLLQLLRADASRPLKTLAAAVNLSRSSVRERISRMQGDGTIRRYTVETAPRADVLTALLLVRLARTPDPDVVRAVVECEAVFRCRSLSGPIDLLVEIAGSQMDAINRTRDHIAQLPGVVDVETSFVLKLDKAPD
jgi:Lrp/AsnC family transcriptional regulator, leucine-responsive regulatory protein